MPRSGTLTLLFSDLVNSTDHLENAGDEDGQRFFRAHHKLISEAIVACAGEELQWLGDGALAAFESSADAVRCAIKIQQTARRPVANLKFEVRVGIHCGEAVRQEQGYFGTAVVVARRLCNEADAGQILCSKLVADLLSSRAFKFRSLGPLRLKGINEPIEACETLYERNDPIALLNRTPFVGRGSQIKRLLAKLELACNGHGAIAMLQGEPGIGKTRVVEEFTDVARQHRAIVLRGACYDGEFQPPYGPFAEAITDYARIASASELKAVLRDGASSILRIAPSLRRQLGDVPEPQGTMDKEEERFRLLDVVAQTLIAVSQGAPLVLVLDDLHWADRGTAAMLNHVAHFVSSNPILLIGAYRDAEVDGRHPLAPVVASIRRLPNFENIALQGLAGGEVEELLNIVGDQETPSELVNAISSETSGNPFFIRELLMHLVEEGKILSDGQQWSAKLDIEALGIPDGVREIVGRRVQRLSDDARTLLSIGAAFKGEFSFDVAANVANLDEVAALNALDEGLKAQLLRPGAGTDKFDFSHALIRHTLYSVLNPARRVRLHRSIAETMEQHWGERAAEHAAEVAYHFWRSASASGRADRGVDYSIAAANNAEAACAYDEVVAFLRIALEMVATRDPRRTGLLARLGLALAWTLNGDGAYDTAILASEQIAATDGSDAAATYLDTVVQELFAPGLTRHSWRLAREGLRLVGDRRDMTWARLREIDLAREEAEDPGNPGIRVDSEGQREWRAVLRTLPTETVKIHRADTRYDSRLEIINDPNPNAASLLLLAGEYKRALPLWQKDAGDAESRGRIGWAVTALGNVACCHVALGEFEAARATMARGHLLVARVSSSPSGPKYNLNLISARHDLRVATDQGWEELLQDPGGLDVLNSPKPEDNWAFAMIRACGAYFFSRINQETIALEWIASLRNAFERGAPWEPTYSAVLCDAAAVLWSLDRTESASIIEHCILNKILVPDFRYPMRDSRLSLARLCALQNRFDEASDWFARAREVLDEQGARPLRALADYDEATMYLRRSVNGDMRSALPLLESARDQFRSIGMTGWLQRADDTLSHAIAA